MTNNETTIKAITQVLRRHPWVRAAWVFGSVADGRVRPSSDLDVAVLGDKPLQAEQKSMLIRRLAQAVGRPVDLIDLQATQGPLSAKFSGTGGVSSVMIRPSTPSRSSSGCSTGPIGFRIARASWKRGGGHGSTNHRGEARVAAARRIETKRPRRVEVVQDDWDLQDIIALNMTRAVPLASYPRAAPILGGVIARPAADEKHRLAPISI